MNKNYLPSINRILKKETRVKGSLAFKLFIFIEKSRRLSQEVNRELWFITLFIRNKCYSKGSFVLGHCLGLCFSRTDGSRWSNTTSGWTERKESFISS